MLRSANNMPRGLYKLQYNLYSLQRTKLSKEVPLNEIRCVTHQLLFILGLTLE